MLKWNHLKKKYTKDWDYKTKRETTLLLNAVTSFEFMDCTPTSRYKERGVDIIDVYDDVSSVIKDKKSTRKNIDKEFRVTFEQVERVAAKNGTQTSMPRIAKRQVIRDNTECDTPKNYYRRVFAIPLIDKLISELELRFTKLSHFASRLLFLIPTVIIKVPLGKDSYQQIIEMHGKGLLYKDVVDIELSSWKHK